MKMKFKTSPWSESGQWVRSVPKNVVIIWEGNQAKPYRIPKRAIGPDGGVDLLLLEEVEVIVDNEE